MQNILIKFVNQKISQICGHPYLLEQCLWRKYREWKGKGRKQEVRSIDIDLKWDSAGSNDK
jgi:hypothetical protein